VIPHKGILESLQSLGIQGNLLKWIESFLMQRTFQVKIGDLLSPPRPVSSGVPQGSVLGPLLFLIYINSLPAILCTNTVLYADDIKLWSTSASDLQLDIDRCQSWMTSHSIAINPAKTVAICFGDTADNPPPLTILQGSKRVLINYVKSHKDLGVWISNDLSPSKMCVETVKKATRTLHFFKRLFPRLDPDTLRHILVTYIRPILEYNSQAWLPHLKRDQILLELVQRRATKLVPCLRNLPYELRRKKLNLFPLQYRRIRGCLIHTFKLFQANRLSSYFVLSDTKNLRGHPLKLFVPRLQSKHSRNFFTYIVIPYWNKLPTDIFSCSTPTAFKHSLDKVLPNLISYD
jgi:ribonucleases P/MRP protein subunit RPP40